ncbi:hypothetical protein M422DRAFT_52126 [Sphaerobolus stellatus SS14]|uniref:F-box domain-containing protein n=1 Tax=Sphaerobolus stellatus (strain SS14) TaxID=990650 RepID=A0A0C9V9Y9_SPHS4|nr:hypothetical protein M422DRAFT_52126 [Sphaerobolus stellatus SS14]
MDNRTSIHDLPNELIDHVVSFIDLPNDLLHFALTSQRIHDIIIPDHIDSRIIEFPTRDAPLDIWSAIVAKPVLARHVRIFKRMERAGTNRYPPSLLSVSIPPRLPHVESVESRDVSSLSDEHLVIMTAISVMAALISFEDENAGAPISHILFQLSTACPNIMEIKLCQPILR